MYIVFEDSGDFKAGTVVAEQQGNLQVETHTGKRIKVKRSHVMFEFQSPDPATLMQQAPSLAEQIDLNLIWECAPREEFGFDDIAQTYYGDKPSAIERYALLLAVHGSPVHFYRKGRGRYKSAPEETLKAALAALEKRKLQQVQIEQWVQELVAGRCPDPFRAFAAQLIVSPDKNGPHYKALQAACDARNQSPSRLLTEVGAFKTPFDLHYRLFISQAFPKGVGFREAGHDTSAFEAQIKAVTADLPLSPAKCFSIDDSSTTEIDDCLSVQWLTADKLRIGVHIAAPALVLHPDSPFDLVARERMSTLYMPGDKVTMLPDTVIEHFSLAEGGVMPAFSLYIDCDAKSGHPIESSVQSCIENIQVAANLRYDLLDDCYTEEHLNADRFQAEQSENTPPFFREISALWRVTQALSAQRDQVRGKPEARNRADFNFRVNHDTGEVIITERMRDAPLDRIVAEMMILANNQWGKLLASHMTAGIYRSQQMGKARMSTYPQPHQGLGVTHYGWFTSPLRRYSDLVNQRQLLAVLKSKAPPFANNDAQLHAVIAAFDSRYGSYNEFQSRMEKYWCLRWVEQQATRQFEAVLVKPGLIRLRAVPLYLALNGLPDLSPGRLLKVDILATDLIELTAEVKFIEVLQGELEPEAESENETAIETEAQPCVDLVGPGMLSSMSLDVPAAVPDTPDA